MPRASADGHLLLPTLCSHGGVAAERAEECRRSKAVRSSACQPELFAGAFAGSSRSAGARGALHHRRDRHRSGVGHIRDRSRGHGLPGVSGPRFRRGRDCLGYRPGVDCVGAGRDRDCRFPRSPRGDPSGRPEATSRCGAPARRRPPRRKTPLAFAAAACACRILSTGHRSFAAPGRSSRAPASAAIAWNRLGLWVLFCRRMAVSRSASRGSGRRVAAGIADVPFACRHERSAPYEFHQQQWKPVPAAGR